MSGPYYLTTWTEQTIAGVTLWLPAQLTASYPTLGALPVPGAALPTSSTERLPVTVQGPPADLALLAGDWTFPQLALGPPVQFADYQSGMRAAHDARLAVLAIPVTVAGTVYELPATVAFQSLLMRLVGEIQAGATSVTLTFGGTSHAVTSAVFLAALRSYATQLRAVPAAVGTGTVDHLNLRSAIESASSTANLDAVTIN